MSTVRKKSPVYAYVMLTQEHGYGHVVAHIHELFGYNGGTLKISCQAGGATGWATERGTYSWEYGVSNDYSVLKTHALHQGYLLMRRIDKRMRELYDEKGEPKTYTEFMLRVLCAVNVPRIYVNSTLGGRLTGRVEDLPEHTLHKGQDALEEQLFSLEQRIIALTR